MTVGQLAPVVETVDAHAAIGRALSSQLDAPFAPDRIAFCAALSAELLRDPEARLYPDLQGAAFRMRPAALARLEVEFRETTAPDCIAAPRGLVFHVPPSNVPSVWLYSWLYAFVTGNRSIIRMGHEPAREREVALGLLRKVCERPRRTGPVVLRYGHCEETTRALSAAADVRVIWGGDETVRALRAIPIAPGARELTFPDRSSLAAIEAASYLDSSGRALDGLAARFFDDVYRLDQMACSSPRFVVWCGSAPAVAQAREDFYRRLRDRIAARGYRCPTGAYMSKTAFGWGAILDTAACRYREYGNELTVLEVETPEALPERHPGGGFLFDCALPDLAALAPWVRRRYQTLGVFGFSQAMLESFARAVCGRGIDRIVPIGSALDFHHVWDGHHLLREFTRNIYLPPQAVCQRATDHVAQGSANIFPTCSGLPAAVPPSE